MAMLYSEFLTELKKAGLSVRAYAGLIGMNPNSISNYARRGEVPSHHAFIAVLVAELNALRIDYRRVMAKVDLAPKKPRGSARRGHFGGDPQANLDFDKGQNDG